MPNFANPNPPGSFLDVLRRRAEERPEFIAARFLGDGEHETASLTYAALLERSLAVAAHLQQLGAAGERVLILLPPGLEYVTALLGCFASGALAVPAYPPRGRRGASRLAAIARDCHAAFAFVDPLRAQYVPESGVRLQCVDPVEIDNAAARNWTAPELSIEDPVYLQYTSGSTADPRGVVLTHRNLLAHAELITENFHGSPDSVGVSWLPPYHDMGLIGSILQPIFFGAQMVLMPPFTFLQRPLRWLQAIERYKADISGGPNFAFELAVAATTEEQRAGLDLSSWRVAFCGAEPIRAQTLARFAEAFAVSGFKAESLHPCYGLAEATLAVASSRYGESTRTIRVSAALWERNEVREPRESEEARTLIGSGEPLRGVELQIVDPATHRPVAAGEIGEIWVRGPQVAAGYFGREQESATTFAARLAEGEPNKTFLRTGDLGFLRENELFVSGRLKEMIILHGRNFFPHDLEQTLEACHPAFFIAGTAAFSIDRDDREQLIAAAEIDRRLPEVERHEAIAAIRQALAEEYEIEPAAVLLLRRGSLPKTTSGKAQRPQCRARFLDGTLDVLARWDRPPQGTSARPASRQLALPPRHDEAAILNWLRWRVAELAGMPESRIELTAPFSQYGLGSTAAAAVAGELSDALGRPISPTLVYEYPSIQAAARFLAGKIPQIADSQGAIPNRDPLAIVGLACRFPGAADPTALWEMLLSGGEAVRPMPGSRRRGYFPAPGESEAPRAGWLEEVDTFDAEFFAISPREAVAIDPQQRLALELACEAFHDAGLPLTNLRGSRTGVFLGISTGDYGQRQLQLNTADVHANTGSALSIAANRISYALDLRGPSLAVDTACSSSLAAIHLACRALAAGECELAIAGGVSLLLNGRITANLAAAGFMAADGRCKAFDAAADGYVRGEGAGLVVLRPLSAAREAGDRIYAVIRGTAMTQDGRSNGLTAPSREAQVAVLRSARAAAGVTAEEIDYLETHGTGTVLGDAVEARALGESFGESLGESGGLNRNQPWLIGSVKTNLGHLEAAAGVAGLMKTALAIYHGTLPPSLHFHEPNPHIPFEELRLQVVQEATPWPERDHPRRAGVSSFGFGGTNVHAVLEAAPQVASRLETAGEDREVAAICSAAAHRTEHFPHRLAVVGENREDLVAALHERIASLVDSPAEEPFLEEAPAVVFLFAGQGARLTDVDWAGLLAFPAFAESWNASCGVIERTAGWSAEETLRPGHGHEAQRSDRVQPLACALGIALAELWRSLGVEPAAVIGHSLGEISAAAFAGVLEHEEALELAIARGRLVQTLAGSGKTAALALSREATEAFIAEGGRPLEVAAVNGPNTTVVSGPAEAIEQAVAELAEREVFARELPIDVAFHSRSMEPLQGPLREACRNLRPSEASTKLISTVTGEPLGGKELDGEYWARNLREPVNLAAAVRHVLEADQRIVLLELSAHSLFSAALAPLLAEHSPRAGFAATLRRGIPAGLAVREAAGLLFEHGVRLKWSPLVPRMPFTPLPVPPWRREQFWLAAESAEPMVEASR